MVAVSKLYHSKGLQLPRLPDISKGIGAADI